jgi:hypothetical protein
MSHGKQPAPAGSAGAASGGRSATARPRTGAPAAPLGLAVSELRKRVGYHGPQLKLSGAEAMRVAGLILKDAYPLIVPSSMGPVRLVPGTVWAGRRQLIYVAPLYCYFTIDDRLYEWGTSKFVQDEWFNALATGASRASYWETIAKAEAALICGIFFPWYVMLGITCASLTIQYFTHKKLIHDVIDKAPPVIVKLRELRDKHPEQFNRLFAKAARELLTQLPSGVGTEDVAFFIGRVIKGAAAAPELTLRALLKIIAITLPLVTITHAPAMTGHALEAEVKRRAKELQEKATAAGYSITLEEAEIIIKDSLSRGDASTILQDLKRAIDALAPSVEELTKVL